MGFDLSPGLFVVMLIDRVFWVLLTALCLAAAFFVYRRLGRRTALRARKKENPASVPAAAGHPGPASASEPKREPRRPKRRKWRTLQPVVRPGAGAGA